MNLRHHILVAGLVFLAVAVRAETGLSADGVAWNAGVDAYRNGRPEQALALIRPLLETKSYGVRAAELVAKIEYDAANAPGCSNVLEHLEASAQAAQTVLRARPRDRRANDNFTRATEGLAELRETRRREGVLKAAEGKGPDQLVRPALADVRRLHAEVKELAGLPAEARVSRADELEARARRLADVWLPVREAAAQAVTNQAELVGFDNARELTLTVARALGDLAPPAVDGAGLVEDALAELCAGVSAPPEAMADDLTAQSNAWAEVEAIGRCGWQEDALHNTRSFRRRFAEWADAYEQSRASDTNAPPLTVETRERIEALAAQLETNQLACVESPDKTLQRKSLEQAEEILKLLPQQPNQQKQQQQQNQQDNRNQQNQPKDQSQNQQQDQQKQQDQPQQDQQEQPQRDEAKEREEQQGEQSPAQPPEAKDDEERKVEAAEAEERKDQERKDEDLLKRILERSIEHEQGKRLERQRKTSLRDW